MSFTHLHVHTEYSLLDGSNKIREYVARVKELGMTAAAITDHGVMYGVVDFYRECKKNDINPIIGCEVYVAPGSRFDKKKEEGEDRYYHLVLLAENNKGYENLSRIVSRSFTEGFYYKPRVDIELLREFHEGIIASSACLAGEVARNITRDDMEAAEEAALRYQDIFGKGNFFLELQDHGYADQQKVNSALLRMHKKLGIPLIATNDVHYTRAEDAEAHDILLCVQTGKKLSDENRMRYPGGQFYVKSEEEMRKLFPYAQEAIDNTQKIADRCHVEIEFGVLKLPHYEVPAGYDSWTYLNKLCDDGMKERYPDDDGTIRERLNYELNTIRQMGYVDYFLIVWDYINYARENDIPVGPGRGSAAGSVVSYCLHITNLDPIRYNLLFERFLNPERVSMPDIDVDFCFERRGEVIDYVTRKYGKDKVMQIVTFVTMAARGVIRDVGRVMDLPYGFVDQIAKMVPEELNITLDKALEISPEMKKAYEQDKQVKELLDMSRKLEGLPRNTSVHAAGVVICSRPAEELIPLARANDGSTTTQFTMTTVEELGLLKMDFLALKTLTVIKNAADMAGVSIDDISYEDPKVYEFIGTGKTDGVFQLESSGMQGFMKELRPGNLEDVIAGISLYRPGPMDFIPQYIAGKNDPSKVTYACPQLEPILKTTFGTIVYQEQVMQIVRDLGGYTMGRSDLVRRAMSKKKQHVMEQERKNFVYGNKEEGVPGCVANGISEEIASHIYDTMMDFAKYAFNKSHAACYAVIAYQTAWLKYYYPDEYMAALISSVMDKPAKVAGYIYACRDMGISLLGPDINESSAGFSVSEKGVIRYGLAAVKSVGVPVIEGIIKEREERGPFSDLENFIERERKAVNKRVLENFIRAGAFDCFGQNRRQLLVSYGQISDLILKGKCKEIDGQMSIFDFADEEEKKGLKFKYPDVEELPMEEKLNAEKEVLGVYVSGHPLDEYEKTLRKKTTKVAVDFLIDDETGKTHVVDDERCIMGGQVTAKKIVYTKKGNKPMAFVTLEDLTGTVEVIFFPKTYEKYSSYLDEDKKLLINGRASVEPDKDAKLIAGNVNLLEKDSKEDIEETGEKSETSAESTNAVETDEPGTDVSETDVSETAAETEDTMGTGKSDKRTLKGKRIYVRFQTMADLINESEYLKTVAAANPGDGALIACVMENDSRFALPIEATAVVLLDLRTKYGKDNVIRN